MEWPVMWAMLNTGIHPKNLITLGANAFERDLQGWWLQFKRAKNSRPRRELLPDNVGEGLVAWVRTRGHPRTRQGIWELVRRVGERAGLAEMKVSPMTLRHTACIHFLRQYRNHPDRMLLVAARMGCTVGVVQQNYIDMEEWEKQTWGDMPSEGNSQRERAVSDTFTPRGEAK